MSLYRISRQYRVLTLRFSQWWGDNSQKLHEGGRSEAAVGS